MPTACLTTIFLFGLCVSLVFWRARVSRTSLRSRCNAHKRSGNEQLQMTDFGRLF